MLLTDPQTVLMWTLVAGDNLYRRDRRYRRRFSKGSSLSSHRNVTHSLSMRSAPGTVQLIEGRRDPERSFLVNHRSIRRIPKRLDDLGKAQLTSGRSHSEQGWWAFAL